MALAKSVGSCSSPTGTDALLVPGKGLDAIPGGTGMEHIHQSEAAVADGGGEDLGGALHLA